MFKIANRAMGDVEPFEHLDGAADLALGSAATMTAGALTKATGKPTHIIMGTRDSRGKYPAIRVFPSTVFETVSGAKIAGTAIGSSVTLASDALGVTATTTDGVFTITETDEGTPNSVVRGYFA
ncbi:hypothetical protein [Intestinibacillus massiliensis]